MNKKRYYKFLDDKQEWVIRDRTNRRNEYRVGKNKIYAKIIVDLLNSLLKKNEQLKKEKMLANAFIVEKRLEVEFVRWCKEDE